MNHLPNSLSTERLQLTSLHIEDAQFIHELVNTAGWLQYIGDRNVRSLRDAEDYIQKILANPDVRYWVVRLKGEQEPMGIITHIKRATLPHPDLGFAFLPAFFGQGYAYEASLSVLQFIFAGNDQSTAQLNAITVPGNTSSVKLLTRLGFAFVEEQHANNEVTHVYAVDAASVASSRRS